jgi:prephenate dehydrogenase
VRSASCPRTRSPGTEHSGAAAAFPTLFRDRTTILTPGASTALDAVATVRAMWETCGARVSILDAAQHDRIFAAVSHLPHVLAFALVAELAARPDAADLFAHAASGFRDFTRIAGSSPEMWRDIALANRAALSDALRDYRAMLDRMAHAIERGDGAALERCSRRRATRGGAGSSARRRRSPSTARWPRRTSGSSRSRMPRAWSRCRARRASATASC